MKLPGIALLLLITAIPLSADDDTEKLNLEKDPHADMPVGVHHDEKDASMVKESMTTTNSNINAEDITDNNNDDVEISGGQDTVSARTTRKNPSEASSSSSSAIHDEGDDAENDIVDEIGDDITSPKQAQHEQIEEATPPSSSMQSSNRIENETQNKQQQGQDQNPGNNPSTEKEGDSPSSPPNGNSSDTNSNSNSGSSAVNETDDDVTNIDPTPAQSNDNQEVREGTEPPPPPIEEVADPQPEKKRKPVMVDYANKATGALIVDKSRNFQGTSNLLVNDKDKYAIVPCDEGDEETFVIIGLSEDILVKTIKLSNYEKFSSRSKRFEVLGSQTYPVMTDWELFGVFDAKPWYKENQEQAFELEVPSWARYLQFRFLDHYGDEHYCTATQIKVHGSTTLQGFHEMQLEKETQEIQQSETAQAQEANEDINVVDANTSGATVDVAAAGETLEEQNVEPSKEEVAASSSAAAGANTAASGDSEKEDSQEKVVLESSDGAGTGTINEQKDDIVHAVSNDSSADVNKADTDEPIMEEPANAVSSSSDGAQMIESTENGKESSVNDVDSENPSIVSGNHDQIQDDGKRNESRTESSTACERNNNDSSNQDANTTSETDAGNTLSTSEETPSHATNDRHDKQGNDTGDAIDDSTTEEGESSDASPTTTGAVRSAVQSAIQSAKKAAGVVKDTVVDEADQNEDEEGRGIDDDKNNLGERVEPPPLEESNDSEIVDETSSENVDSSGNVVEESAHSNGDGKNATPMTAEDLPSSTTSSNNLTKTATSASSQLSKIKMYEDLISQLSKTTHSNMDCLDNINFQQFKENAIRKAAEKKGTTGSTSSQKVKNKNEPLFQTLTNEIKTLETSQRVYEQYIDTATNCYQQVILDLGIELMVIKNQQEQRFGALEEQISQLRDAEEQRRPLTLEDVVDTFKGYFGQATAFVHECFPVCTLWAVYLYSSMVALFQRILANERVQQGLEIVASYERDLKTFFLGAVFCYIYVMFTKRKEKGQDQDEKEITVLTPQKVAYEQPDTSKRSRRKDRRKKLKSNRNSHPDLPSVSPVSTLQSALSLGTDIDSS